MGNSYKGMSGSMEALLKAQTLLFNAPAVFYLTLTKGHTAWSIYDLGEFGMTLMLAAKDRGIDTVSAYEIVKYPDELRRLLDVPDDQDVIMGIALGYASDDKMNEFSSQRLPLEEILTLRK